MSNVLPVKLNSLRSRMLLVFLLMLALIMVATLVTVQTATYGHSTGQVRSHALTSARVVQDKIQNRATQLSTALSTFSQDFSTKGLIRTGKDDPASLRSALGNHQKRMEADLSWVLDQDGRLLSSTAETEAKHLEVSAERYLTGGIHWLKLDNHYYLVQAAPVKFVESSPRANAWLFGAIDAAKLIEQQLVELTDMQVSLMADGAVVVGSTLPMVQAETLLSQVNQVLHSPGSLKLDDMELLFFTFPIGQADALSLQLVLVTPADKAYLSYNSLLGQLALILALAAALALIAAIVVSNGITRPLTSLVSVTNKISKGQYIDEVPQSSTAEIASLSGAISEMQQGIRQRELEIQQLAYFDALTGLPNRNQFNEQLRELIAAQKAVTLLVMDLDRFKDINDTLGHGIGDQLLKLVANRLATLAVPNLFMARLGGDEFGLLCFDDKQVDADTFAKKVRAIFEQPFAINKIVLELDASIGLAVCPEHSSDPDNLVQLADIAMYSCKGHHHSYAIYAPALNKYSVQRLSLMTELKSALASDQLQLYYQPKLDLKKSKVVGVECLVRWIHPVHGFIAPDQFIPLAEQTGAIRHLTNWALRKALQQQQAWRNLGFELQVAVNISALDLVDMKLPEHLAALLDEYQANPSSLILEVTESALMMDAEAAMRALQRIHDMGLVLSIDDFGTGYSSMGQLKQMPVHELKIDKAFVLDLANNKDDQVMVKTLVSLAQHLELSTVAEGVEDEQALSMLREVGCDKAQGFYLSKPLPAAQFESWLRSYQPPLATELNA
ncbi:EAL domain-containing protein [Aliiglaciecola sp. CAU 1673]|uniref:EAL domain-containing protein n=1 Tax=Aliiglaciecola sp. CAU 1673 TaxID=3032595 RepID=UPI0023D9F2A6|nr:EAL domain-containing protein [Aliiglaciecola sp. CAU 1673]MDF2179465.1 EAL domain-containing protein [Aliiglaciecola sp. CAU 1673]